MDNDENLVDWAHFEKSRGELGPGFIRILGYFREDGAKSVAQIEAAMREQNTVALVSRRIRSRAKRASSGPIRSPIAPN